MSEQSMSDNSFTRNFIIMLIAMSILAGILMVLASISASEVNDNLKAEQDAERLPTVLEQIAPIGSVAVASENTSTESQVAEVLDAETVYNGACVACHGAGIAGAPATGDASQWAARLAKGSETLYSSAINGIGAMPAKGGQVNLSDEAVKAAVDFIIEASQ